MAEARNKEHVVPKSRGKTLVDKAAEVIRARNEKGGDVLVPIRRTNRKRTLNRRLFDSDFKPSLSSTPKHKKIEHARIKRSAFRSQPAVRHLTETQDQPVDRSDVSPNKYIHKVEQLQVEQSTSQNCIEAEMNAPVSPPTVDESISATDEHQRCSSPSNHSQIEVEQSTSQNCIEAEMNAPVSPPTVDESISSTDEHQRCSSPSNHSQIEVEHSTSQNCIEAEMNAPVSPPTVDESISATDEHQRCSSPSNHSQIEVEQSTSQNCIEAEMNAPVSPPTVDESISATDEHQRCSSPSNHSQIEVEHSTSQNCIEAEMNAPVSPPTVDESISATDEHQRCSSPSNHSQIEVEQSTSQNCIEAEMNAPVSPPTVDESISATDEHQRCSSPSNHSQIEVEHSTSQNCIEAEMNAPVSPPTVDESISATDEHQRCSSPSNHSQIEVEQSTSQNCIEAEMNAPVSPPTVDESISATDEHQRCSSPSNHSQIEVEQSTSQNCIEAEMNAPVSTPTVDESISATDEHQRCSSPSNHSQIEVEQSTSQNCIEAEMNAPVSPPTVDESISATDEHQRCSSPSNHSQIEVEQSTSQNCIEAEMNAPVSTPTVDESISATDEHQRCSSPSNHSQIEVEQSTSQNCKEAEMNAPVSPPTVNESISATDEHQRCSSPSNHSQTEVEQSTSQNCKEAEMNAPVSPPTVDESISATDEHQRCSSPSNHSQIEVEQSTSQNCKEAEMNAPVSPPTVDESISATDEHQRCSTRSNHSQLEVEQSTSQNCIEDEKLVSAIEPTAPELEKSTSGTHDDNNMMDFEPVSQQLHLSCEEVSYSEQLPYIIDSSCYESLHHSALNDRSATDNIPPTCDTYGEMKTPIRNRMQTIYDRSIARSRRSLMKRTPTKYRSPLLLRQFALTIETSTPRKVQCKRKQTNSEINGLQVKKKCVLQTEIAANGHLDRPKTRYQKQIKLANTSSQQLSANMAKCRKKSSNIVEDPQHISTASVKSESKQLSSSIVTRSVNRSNRLVVRAAVRRKVITVRKFPHGMSDVEPDSEAEKLTGENLAGRTSDRKLSCIKQSCKQESVNYARSRKEELRLCGQQKKVENKLPQACHIIEGQIVRDRPKKGPPAKGLILSQKLKDKRKARGGEKEEIADSDSEYCPSSDSDAYLFGQQQKVDSKSPQASHSVECQTLQVRSKKGPPAKGLILLQQLKDRKKALAREKDDVTDSESDYRPSSDSDTDSSNSELDSSSISDSEVSSNVPVPENNCIGGSNAWHEVKGNHKQFKETWRDNLVPSVSGGLSRPIDVYRSLLDEEVIRIMVQATNAYASNTVSAENVGPHARIRSWIVTDEDEMKKFIGLLLYMGLVKMPSIQCYWQKQKLYRNCIAPQVMTRNRFQLLLRMWHFTISSDLEITNRLQKIESFVDLLLQKFCKARTPEGDLVVDESMIAFRGRLKFRQYMPGKSHKYGIKLFKLCDPNGYTYKVTIYAGKGETVAKNLGTKVVMSLAADYLNAGRTMCTDNYYTSVGLAQELLMKKTHLLGTLRSNRRDLPNSVKTARLKVGEVIAAENDDGVVVMKWKDKRDVLLLSTKNDARMVDSGRLNRKKEKLVKPQAILDYNKSKQGIDLSDQLASYHSCLRKTIRWFHKVAIEMILGTSIVNALILFNKEQVAGGKKSMSVTSFRESICSQLLNIDKPMQTDEENHDASADVIGEVNNDVTHYLRQSTEMEGGQRNDRRKRRACVGCYDKITSLYGREVAKKKVKRVLTECGQCPKNPRFCFECFKSFHF